MKLARIVAPLSVLGLVAAALGGTALPAAAASAAPPPDWLRPFQVQPSASVLMTMADLGRPQTPCPAVIAYVSRGAGENADNPSEDYAGRSKYYGGVGEEMSPVVNRLASMYGSGFKVIANAAPAAAGQPGYPATTISWQDVVDNNSLDAGLMNSIHAGAQNAIDNLNAINLKCRSTKLAVIGFSQGSSVVRNALSTRAGAAINGKKLNFDPLPGHAVSMTFGDVTWGRNTNPGVVFDPRYVGDTMAPGALPAGDEAGLTRWMAQHGYPASRPELLVPGAANAAWNAATWCHGNDPACQFAHQAGQAALGLPGHNTYDEKDFFGAANYAASVWRTAGLTTSVAAPAVQLAASTVACLPRGVTTTRTATMAASTTGPRTFTSAWQPTAWTTDGTVTPGSRSLAAGATGSLSAKATANFFLNDVWLITAQTGIPAAPTLPVYYSRICPA